MGKDKAALYKSGKFADTRVQIRKLQRQQDGSGPAAKRRCPRWQAASTAAAAGKSPSFYTVVDEFPAHRAYLYDTSKYFQAASGWEDLSVVCFDVEEHQVGAAQALVHFMYHEALKPDLLLADVGQLLVLADRYQVAACVEACVQQLQPAMDQGKNCDAVLDAIALLGQLGSLSSEVQGLFAFFKAHATTIRTTLADLVTVPYDPEAKPEPTQGPAFDKAVGVLRATFCDMDAAWGQQGLRDILHLFPMEVVRELLLWDGLVCVSENVVVVAIHHWLEVQPSVPVADEEEEQQQRREVHERALLLTVRVPFLSQAYLAQIFPSLPWVKKQDPLLRSELMAAAMWHVSGKSGRLCADLGEDKLPTNLFCPRQYKPSMPEAKVELEVSWEDIHAARLRAQEQGAYESVDPAPVAWVNGFHVGLDMHVRPPASPAFAALRERAVAAGGVGLASDVEGSWFWKQLTWQNGCTGGDITAISSFELEFSSSPSAPLADGWQNLQNLPHVTIMDGDGAGSSTRHVS